MSRSTKQAELQPILPGLGPVRESRQRVQRPRGRSHARVWSDPAVIRAAGDADDRYVDWRGAFAEFLRRQPDERRRELRNRLHGNDSTHSQPSLPGLTHAA
jgi:hypothetical protein